MNLTEAQTAWRAHRGMFEAQGIHLPDAQAYLPDGFGTDYSLAMDAQPALSTTPNNGVPFFMTSFVDPKAYEILFSPTKGEEIYGATKEGTWEYTTALFPTVEFVGEVSSYDDFAETGHTGVNADWPQRQNYLFQTMKEVGDLQTARVGLGKINYVGSIDKAAIMTLNRAKDLIDHFGVAGLQNYGMLNDPSLNAAITPATKQYGGVKWVNNGAVVATANEVYNDIQSLYYALVTQSNGVVEGIVDAETPLKLVLAPQVSVALTAANTFNVNVADLLKKNFPKIEIVTDFRFGAQTTINPQGLPGGNLVQLIASNVGGQDTGTCAFSEKLRAHPMVRMVSSWKQKMTSGAYGAVIRQPFAIAQLLGV